MRGLDRKPTRVRTPGSGWCNWPNATVDIGATNRSTSPLGEGFYRNEGDPATARGESVCDF